jgi:effector-binding domain-containing protein
MRSIITVDVAPQKVIGLRRTGRYEDSGEMIREVFVCIREQGISVTGPPAYICHEESVAEVHKAQELGNADIEVVFPVEGDAKGCGDITVYELPGGKMARIIHMGPYPESVDTYNELFAWFKKNNYTLSGPIREVYINDPKTTEEDLLVTWIYAPIC